MSIDESETAVGQYLAWLVVWTRPRAEKAVAKAIESRSFPIWLPTVTVRRRWSDRWKEVEFPLFPGYLFAQVPIDNWSALLRVPGVLTVVKHGRKPARIREGQMADLRFAIDRLISCGQAPEVVHDFEPGERVGVVDGPMQGLAGVVREMRGKRRLLVGFEQIGTALTVSIGTERVTRCDE